MRCSFTANYPAHIVQSAIQGAFPDPLALSANMFSTMPTGFRSFTRADRVVHSGIRSAGPGADRRSQVESRSGRILKLSVGLTSQAYLLETEGLFTQGSRPGRTVGGSVGGFSGMDCSDWSNGIQDQIFYTRPDTEFKESII